MGITPELPSWVALQVRQPPLPRQLHFRRRVTTNASHHVMQQTAQRSNVAMQTETA